MRCYMLQSQMLHHNSVHQTNTDVLLAWAKLGKFDMLQQLYDDGHSKNLLDTQHVCLSVASYTNINSVNSG